MWCPKCGCEISRVIHTQKANNVRRWRRCIRCNHSFTTREKLEAHYEELSEQQLQLFEEQFENEH